MLVAGSSASNDHTSDRQAVYLSKMGSDSNSIDAVDKLMKVDAKYEKQSLDARETHLGDMKKDMQDYVSFF